MKKLGLLALSLMISGAAAANVGISTHPFTMKKQVLTTEFNNYLNNGKGTGLTAKFFQRVSDKVNIDAGTSFSDGERSNRFFAGVDVQLIPDYGRQARVSIKTTVETLTFKSERVNSFGATPIISKGFSFWGKEAFPFLSLPMKVSLNTDKATYETSTALGMGITGRLPFRGYENLVANVETNLSLRNSYSSIVFGISLPIQ